MAKEITLDDLTDVKFIWDAALGSPAELQKYANRVVAVPPDMLPLPARGKFLGIGGFSRQVSTEDGTAWEWVMQGTTDPVDNFVDSLPAPSPWLVPASRTAVKLMITRLFSAGIPRNTIATQIPQFYAAIANQVRAEVAAQQPPA